MNRQQMLTKLYKHVLKRYLNNPSVSVVTQDIQVQNVGQLLELINTDIPEDKQKDAMVYTIEKIASPLIIQSYPFDGVCGIKCQSCKLVPIRHLIFKQCGHVFCIWCAIKSLVITKGQIQCNKCHEYSNDLLWSQQIVNMIDETKDIICYHCNKKFIYLSDYKQHIHEQEKYFESELTKTITEQYQVQEKYRNEKLMLLQSATSVVKPKSKKYCCGCCSCCCCSCYLIIFPMLLTVITIILANHSPVINTIVYDTIDILNNIKDIDYLKDMHEHIVRRRFT